MRKLKIIGYGKSKGNQQISFDDQIRHRIDSSQSHFTLATDAIHIALERAELSINEIDAIIYAGAVGYQPIPCSAALICEQLHTKKPIPCMDINTSCTSFVSALDVMSYMVSEGRYNRILIVSADVASIGLNQNQKESYELFSDGSAAFIIERTDEERGVVFGLQKTWIEGVHDTEIRGGLTSFHPKMYSEATKPEFEFDMKGRKVLFLAAKKVPEFMEELEQTSGYKLSDFSMIVPHQASRALSMIMKRLGVKNYIDKVQDYGNMVASSIPFILCEALENDQIKTGDTILLFGTAAGLSINGLIMKL